MADTDRTRPVVTLEQARLMHEHGIGLRTDGKWGYKKRCANPKCNERREDTCHCADTLEEAVRLSRLRSNLTHSWNCFVDSRFAIEWLDESDDAWGWAQDHRVAPYTTVVKHDDCENPDEGLDCGCCADGDNEIYIDWEGMRATDRATFDALLRGLDDGDYEPDEDECSCEVPADG